LTDTAIPPLTLSVTNVDDTDVIVHVTGELDQSNADRFIGYVDTVAGWPGTRRITLDAAALDFVDSSGIAALLRCQQHAFAGDIDFRLAGVHGMVADVLGIAGLLDFFTERPTP
jgi:anti-anti-sigma factor